MELNKVYNMDNLELLRQLDDESVDLIYCDILYNTGKKFKDYDDRLGTPQEAIEWYKPRLIEMKRVLKSTGSIVLQCDNNLSHYLKIEMDNIFGVKNFVNEIIWKRSNGNSLSKSITNIYDSIFIYSKTNDFVFNMQYHKTEDKKWLTEKETGRRFTHAKLENLANYKYDGEERMINGKTYTTNIGWKWSQETIDSRLSKNPYLFYITKNNKVRYKIYEDENKGKNITNLWTDIQLITSNSKESCDYFSQKPKALLQRIINMLSDKGGIIADFFCGSGTTLVVAKELGRQYIGCDINLRAVEITNQRLNEVIHNK